MRLLEVQTNGGVSLTGDLHHDIPSYAILSHTWESDAQEVNFNDIKGQIARTKRGYRKVNFCQKQATKDGLWYFWIDSCCISRDSEVEINRSINSMFRWYRNAEKCYVYLSDVTAEPGDGLPGWEETLPQSRWFTRGWTLQELIAPRVVEFFSSDGHYLGDKASLEHQLHAITKIPIAALRGAPLSEFGIEERMSWSRYRETKVAEDKAYCLLGIFDIHVPLIYGEGYEHARRRLGKELEGDMHHAHRVIAVNLRAGYEPRQLKAFSTVPFGRDSGFVDRPEILAWIQKKCEGPATRAALTGIGGIGKSQAVIEYVYRLRVNQPQIWVFWMHASTTDRIREAYRSIADRLDLPGRFNSGVNACQLVNNWLSDEANGRWILVLDNADDARVFFPQHGTRDAPFPLGNYLPQSQNGSILVTSRNMDAALRIVGEVSNIMQVQAMEQGQALQLLRNRLHTTSSEGDMGDLAHALDCIPLAITQAAAYINRRARMTVHSYLDEFRRSTKRKGGLLDRDLGDLRRDASASNSVSTTWRLSFESISKDRPSAADMLSLMSFFSPHRIPEWVLRKYKETLTPDEDANMDTNADVEFDDDIETLQAFAFLTRAVDDDVYDVHAIVQFCTKAWLSSLGYEQAWRQRFLSLMSREFPTGNFENVVKCRQLIPHLRAVFDREPPGKEAVNEWTKLLTNAAWHLWHQGNYSAAEDLAMKAFKAKERTPGDNDMRGLSTMAVLASVLRGQGKYEEAEKISRRSLEGYQNLIGHKHPDTLTNASNLALILRDQGKLEEAEQIDQEVLEGREKVLGALHSDTLMSMSNLALVWRDRGFYKKASVLTREALIGKEKALGKEHPSTLTSASNLALLLQDQGQFEESEQLNRQALEGREAVLGKRHPHTLISASNLALLLQDQGKYCEARSMNLRVLNAYEEELGVKHPNTLTSVSNLASVLQEQGQYDEAEKLNRRTLAAREEILGKQHPDSLTSLSNLAFTLRLQEMFEESEALNRQALKGREEQLGMQHLDTLTSVNNLALLLRDQKEYKEAEGLSRRALDGYRTELGARHPYTLTSLGNLASILQDQNRHSEAEEISQKVLKVYEDQLGMQHPDTLRSASNLASILRSQKRYAEAEILHHRALQGRQLTLGIKHPDTVKSVRDLASVLHDQGKHTEAEELERQGRVAEEQH